MPLPSLKGLGENLGKIVVAIGQFLDQVANNTKNRVVIGVLIIFIGLLIIDRKNSGTKNDTDKNAQNIQLEEARKREVEFYKNQHTEDRETIAARDRTIAEQVQIIRKQDTTLTKMNILTERFVNMAILQESTKHKK